MAFGAGRRRLSFSLLPSSDYDDEVLARSYSDKITANGAWDLEHQIDRKKKRNRGSKKKKVAVISSAAEIRKTDDVSVLVVGQNSEICEIDSLGVPSDLLEFENSAESKDFINCCENNALAFVLRHESCSRTSGSDSRGSKVEETAEDFNEVQVLGSSPVRLAQENNFQSSELSSMTEETGRVAEDFNEVVQGLCASPVRLAKENNFQSCELSSVTEETGRVAEYSNEVHGFYASPVGIEKENNFQTPELSSLTKESDRAAEELESSPKNVITPIELRQRILNDPAAASNEERGNSALRPRSAGQGQAYCNITRNALEPAPFSDLNCLQAEESGLSRVTKSSWKFFLEEIQTGNSLRRTSSIGSDRNRQRVYNTMFHVPWRCELLIDVGFFVCLDSFLSLLIIMPARIVKTMWKLLNQRPWWRLSASEMSDFGCYLVMACGIAFLQRIDISLIYHIIRGQGTVKLYVVYNVLEILDKLCQSFVEDVVQVLFNSAAGLANSCPEYAIIRLIRFTSDLSIAVIAFIIHSCILLAQAITLSTCIIAHNNALLALLVSNNFAEIKSNVFKRLSKENLHGLAYHDTVERFHITSFLVFVLAQNILEAEGPWFGNFVTNALLVYMCEIMVDTIKHSFLAKFNEIKPGAYSEFLEALCKQTLGMAPGEGRKDLIFVPIAPACVVIRVVTPVFASYLPCGPPLLRLLWFFISVVVTYLILSSLKIIVRMGLHSYALWYIRRCLKRKPHFD